MERQLNLFEYWGEEQPNQTEKSNYLRYKQEWFLRFDKDSTILFSNTNEKEQNE